LRVGKEDTLVVRAGIFLQSIDDLASTTETTSATGSNETDLGSRRSVASNSGRVADVLVVTSSVRVLNGVHGNTTDARPAVSLGLVLVVLTTGLEDGLLSTTTAGNEAHGGTALRRDELLLSGGKLNGGTAGIGVVANDGGVLTRGAGKSTTVTSLLLNVEHDGTLRHVTQRQHVTNVQLGTATAVDELAGVGTLSSDEHLLVLLVLVRVLEHNLGERSSTSRVVNDLLDETTNVTVSLGEVKGSVLRGTLSVLVVRLENRGTSLTLSSNNTAHV
jgi:hypothetical protein